MRLSKRVIWVVALVFAGSALGVGSASGQSSPAQSEFTIVGEWLGLHDCQRIVPMLRDAGLDEFVADTVVGNGLVPGITENADLDLDDPCAGAVPRSHSHFFTEAGAFGSRDHGGAQVDDGSYRVEGDTLWINDAEFGYSVVGDALVLEPRLATDCGTQECRFGNGWRLMVSMPGTTWMRLP